MKKMILSVVVLAGFSIVSCKSKASDEGTGADTMATEVDTVVTVDTMSVTTDTVPVVPADSIPK